MSVVNSIGRLASLVLLAGAFVLGMAGVVYMSLQGEEVRVPEITGKNFSESEKELASLGLKIKKRADRFSTEIPNTVIEQMPKTGETVKTGQLILVVTSKGPGEGDQPSNLKDVTDDDDTDRIEEMISDKPKKAKANSNSNRKKADTARDVAGSNTDTASNSRSGGDVNPSNKKDPGAEKDPSDKPKSTPAPANRVTSQPSGRGSETKPKPPARP